MISILLTLALVAAVAYSAKGPGPCTSGVPDLPAVKLPAFDDKDLGIYYTHAYDTSGYTAGPQDGNCIYSNGTKIKAEGGNVYVRSDLMYYNQTGKEWINVMDMFIQFDASNPSNYVMLDEMLKPQPSASAGRTIFSNAKYNIDYGWYLRNVTAPGDCNYWWSIYSRSKVLGESDYKEAITYVQKQNMITSGAVKIRHDCPNEP